MQHQAVAEAATPAVTELHTVEAAIASPRRAHDTAALAAFLPYVEAADLDEGAARHCAEIRADLKRRGAMIGANDR